MKSIKNYILADLYQPILFFIIGVAVILSYQNSLSGPFVFDDFSNIVDNKHIAISSLKFTEIQDVFSPYQASSSRPIANLSFALNYYFGQFNPVGFHFINILIHIINAWCVFYLFQWYLSRIKLSAHFNLVILSGIAALWWSTNPIQTTAVTYIVQRMTSLSTMFCLISLLIYLSVREQKQHESKFSIKKKLILFFVASVFWVFAMLSKEIAAIFPLLILIHELYFFNLYNILRTGQKKHIFGFLLLCLICIGEVLFFMGPSFIQSILSGYNSRIFTLVERLLTEPRVIFHYIGLFLYPLPSRLRIFYDNYPISHTLWSPPITTFAFAGLFLWLATIILFFKKNQMISFGLLWTALCLLIESSFIPLELVFEHRFYMPSIGFVLAFLVTILWFLQKTKLKPCFLYGCLSILICTQIIGTYSRNRAWSDELSFAVDEAQKNPESVRVLTNLGYALINDNQSTLATMPLQKALAKDPDNILVLNNLYSIYSNYPYHDQKFAESYLLKILQAVRSGKVVRTDTEALNNLAQYLFLRKEYNDSLLLLNYVVKFYYGPGPFQNIGLCYLQLGQFEEAIKFLKLSLELEPDNPKAKFYCALAYQEENNINAAMEILTDISNEDVQDKTLKNNIDTLYNSLKSMAKE
jgi:Tfp pilus assembly protein PilF